MGASGPNFPLLSTVISQVKIIPVKIMSKCPGAEQEVTLETVQYACPQNIDQKANLHSCFRKRIITLVVVFLHIRGRCRFGHFHKLRWRPARKFSKNFQKCYSVTSEASLPCKSNFLSKMPKLQCLKYKPMYYVELIGESH